MSGYRILYHHRIRSDDGQAVHVREVIRALRAAGHQVRECALVPKADGAGTAGQAQGSNLWNRISLPRSAVEVMEIAYARQGARMLRKAAQDFSTDFIYERHALHCDAGLQVSRELDVPLLLEVNALISEEMAQLGLLRFSRRGLRTERRVLGSADRVLAVTGTLRHKLIDGGAVPERTVVVPNGVDLDRFGEGARRAAAAIREQRRLPDEAFVLGFVGFMRDWNRLELAVDLLSRPGMERLRLWLVGVGPALAGVLARAEAAGVGERVHSFGVVAADQVAAHVSAFDAALIPAINDYASPLKLFDSLAAGVPTVAPRQPNVTELVDDGGTALLFEVGDGEALAAQVQRLLDEEGLARRIGAAGRASLERRQLTWAGNAGRIVAAFEAARRERG